MVNAAKLASAKRITAVIPWYFYARQDKKSRPREPITARMVADLLETVGVDRVITMDLHAGQVQGFFRIPVDHMAAVPMFAQYVRDLLGPNVERVAVAPDTGRAKLAGKFAEMIGGELVVLNKERPAHNQARVTGVIGEVEGKVAVMTDDIIDTAGTLCAGAEALKEAGATKVYACATHALLNAPALERIAQSEFERVDRHRHRPGQRPHEARQRRGALDLRAPRGDDPERLRRRLGLSDLRRREPAVLSPTVGVTPQPLIAVSDVEASSAWYCRLLGCTSGHGGAEYERIVAGDEFVLQLHAWNDEHEHLGDPGSRPYGNGALLWFRVDDFDAACDRAIELGAEILDGPLANPRAWHRELWVRDPDGYVVVLASPPE